VAEFETYTPEELEAAAEVFAALVAAGLAEVVAEVIDGAALAEVETLSPDDIDQITVLWEAYVAGTLMPFLVATMIQATDDSTAALAAVLGDDLPLIDEPLDTQRYLAQARNRLVGIGNELWFNARTAIAEGLAAGEAIPTIAARVRDAAQVTEPRARVIARTESHGARNTVNAATVRRVASAFAQPDAFKRRWQAANDDRTRESHRRADGQTVGMNEPFRVGRASLDFPGDPSGPAEETVNCRCTMLTIVDTEVLPLGGTGATLTLRASKDADTAEHTGAMIALAPTEADAQRLALAGFETAEELHLTLAYLGEGADWSIEQQTALIDALAPVVAEVSGVIEGDAFGVNHWKPNGDDPCWVLGVGGEGLAAVHDAVWEALNAQGGPVPENHTPWIPHVCLAYARQAELFEALVQRTGPITFDRLRVAFAGDNTYLTLGEALSAAAYQEDEAMPWSIVEGDERCDAGEFAVVKDEDGELEGCHATREEAEAQLAALNASENEADSEDEFAEAPSAALPATMRNTVPWSGVLVVEGTPTGDGRQFASGSLTWPVVGETASLEIPLGWMYERSHGGMATDKVVNVGRIDTITRVGNELHGTGVLNLDTEWGRKAAEQMGTRADPGFLAGVSIDADDPEDPTGMNVEYVFPEACELSDGDEVDFETELACMMPELTIYQSGRIRAATLVDIPAYVEARLYLDEEVPQGTPVESESVDMSLTASSYVMEIPDLPPAEWFDEPHDEPDIGAITVTDEGRVFGYLAPKHVAHRGIRDKRVEVPMKNVDYGVFMNRVTIADDGRGGFTRLATGPITMGCGHAPNAPHVRGSARQEHYDNSCSVVATVRVGENARGVWIAGAVLPDVTPDQIRRMMACQLSGDWGPHREKHGKRELAGALLVPVPGFPKRSNAYMSMKSGQLEHVTVPVRFGRVVAPQTYSFGTDAAAARIAVSIGRDRKTRLAAFAANLRETLKGA